jgi:DNA segregation ATPase FtsK/SpoIIIE-like protein
VNKQPDDIDSLQTEIANLKFRLDRVEHFLASFTLLELPESGKYALDELFVEAARLIYQTNTASASFLQRQLPDIGYARAAKILDELQSQGLVSPADSTAKPLKVNRDRIQAYLEKIGAGEED